MLAGSLSHPPSIAFGVARAGLSFLIVRDRHGCEHIAARSCGACGEVLTFRTSAGSAVLDGLGEGARAYFVGGSCFDGRGFLSVNELLYKFLAAFLAEARFDAGRVTDAFALVDHALNTGEGPASGLFVPEIHRLRGVFLRSLGSPAEEVERACTA